MQTLREAMTRLEAAGYTDTCRITQGGICFSPSTQPVAPEQVRVDEVIRIEGTSSPDEEVWLFALRDPGGTHRATLALGHPTLLEVVEAEVLARLPVDQATQRDGQAMQRDGTSLQCDAP